VSSLSRTQRRFVYESALRAPEHVGQKPADLLTVTFFDRHIPAADRVGDSIARSRCAIANKGRTSGARCALSRVAAGRLAAPA
jgi:hypothetical protein